MEEKQKNKNLARDILLTSFFLCLIGILGTYSASALKSHAVFETPYYFLYKQSVGVFFGLLITVVLLKLPFGFLRHLPLPFFILSFLMLSLIFIPEVYRNAGGASRWIDLGIVGIQPSEPAKLALIFLLAKNLSRKSFSIKNLTSVYIGHGVILVALSLCLMKQPDFGSTFFVFILTFSMLFISGLRLDHILYSSVVVIPAAVYAILSEPYRAKRIFSFIDPIENMNSGGFQIIQSYLAFNNGGLTGVGLGNSKQKLFYLPEAHTDFILSVLAEELGFLGILLIFFLFFYLIILGLRVSKSCQEPYFKLLSFGLTCFLGLHAIINIGVVLGLLPTKGSSLPFISSGVSSLITCLVCVAVLAKIAMHLDTQDLCNSKKTKKFSL